jgi:hypothetical protein
MKRRNSISGTTSSGRRYRERIFAWRKAGSDVYHLHEIQSDGSGLRQVTDGPYDDYEPTYLPDGDILFVSTRCRRWVNCWMTQVGTLYRCGPDGKDIRPVSGNTEHDNTPWVLPDGRILYTRWEYVDRSQVDYHGLWVMFPDGSGQTVFFGNMHPGIVMIDAKPIPGTAKVLASFSPGHGMSDHAGVATVVTAARGPDDRAAARPATKSRIVRDPYPIAENLFLAAENNRLVLFDDDWNAEAIYIHSGPGGLHEGLSVRTRIIAPTLLGPGEVVIFEMKPSLWYVAFVSLPIAGAGLVIFLLSRFLLLKSVIVILVRSIDEPPFYSI